MIYMKKIFVTAMLSRVLCIAMAATDGVYNHVRAASISESQVRATERALIMRDVELAGLKEASLAKRAAAAVGSSRTGSRGRKLDGPLDVNFENRPLFRGRNVDFPYFSSKGAITSMNEQDSMKGNEEFKLQEVESKKIQHRRHQELRAAEPRTEYYEVQAKTG